MDRSDFLSNSKNKANFEYLLGRHVQDNGQDVQYANADTDVENVKYAINKLAFGFVIVTAYDTGTLFFTMHFYLSDRKKYVLRGRSFPYLIDVQQKLENTDIYFRN